MSEVPTLSAWEERHKGALGASEVEKCLHCSGARLLYCQDPAASPKTNPFTPAQLRRMGIGSHFQDLERERLKELKESEGLDFYDGRDIVLQGFAIPVVARPDFIIREGEKHRVREVKYRTFSTGEPQREWLYQLGVYRLRYDGGDGDFAIYSLTDRVEVEGGEIPSDLVPKLHEWTSALLGVLEGRYLPKELPHDPTWCKGSEWACEDCIGQRTATSTELLPFEERDLQEYLELSEKDRVFKPTADRYEKVKGRVKEILGAHGGGVVAFGHRFRISESSSQRINMKLLTPKLKDQIPYYTSISRSIRLEDESGEAVSGD